MRDPSSLAVEPHHLTSSQKGRIAEAGVALIAAKRGWDAYIPTGDGARVDMVLITTNRTPLRTQAKWGRTIDGVIDVQVSTSRLVSSGGYVRSGYDSRSIDAIAVWSDPLASAYLIPIEEVSGLGQVRLRLEPARNKQSLGVRYASDYFLGAVAQLGERRHGMAEVRGSSPLSST